MSLLPEIRQVKPQTEQFACRWQTVIFRNYRMVPAERIAFVLGCTSEVIHREAARLGLRAGEHDPRWLTEGYITIIRNNWYLLPYEQLLELLQWDETRLEFVLTKEDFLDTKLGKFKPACEKVSYAPLTTEQAEATSRIAETVRKWDVSKRTYFDFFQSDVPSAEPVLRQGKNLRLVHGYLTPCGDAFIENAHSHLPDALLARYAECGVNAVFIHGVLSSLSPYPFDPELSRDYPTRRAHLRELIERAGKWGIKIYLYLDEPRALPVSWFGSRVPASAMGHRQGNLAALCLNAKEGRDYLYTAVRDLFEEIPDIGGIFTITKSEYFTHCTYGGYPLEKCTCPRCSKLPIETMPAMTNNIIMEAIRDSGSKAELIANLWGWSPALGWSDEQISHALEILDRDIVALGISDYDVAIEKGGIKSHVIDYSISNPGPSEVTRKALMQAAKLGHKAYAKVQMNCSWECSSVPYLPVFDLELEHLQNLHAIGVDDLMLTWTLGGYPSIAYDMVADYQENPNGFSMERWYEKHFGEHAAEIHHAVELLCRGFRELPFSVRMLYNSPKNLGPANLWNLTLEERNSTMVCYSFDDYEKWIYPYPPEIYLSQFEKLIVDWQAGCEALAAVRGVPLAEEMLLYARVALAHFKSDLIHTRYALAKRAGDMEVLLPMIDEECAVTEELLQLCGISPLIGYETSNHYFYTERNLIEKLVQMNQMRQQIVDFLNKTKKGNN